MDETQSAKKPGVKAEKSTVQVAATSVEEELTEEPEDIEEKPEYIGVRGIRLDRITVRSRAPIRAMVPSSLG